VVGLLAIVLGTAGCSPGLRLDVSNDSAEPIVIDVREGVSASLLAEARSVLHADVPANRSDYFEMDTGSQGWSVFVNGEHMMDSEAWSYDRPVLFVHVRSDGTVGIE
jgi:hypothetical protein